MPIKGNNDNNNHEKFIFNYCIGCFHAHIVFGQWCQ